MCSRSCSVTDQGRSKSLILPWKEMFRAASFRLPNSDPFSSSEFDAVPRSHEQSLLEVPKQSTCTTSSEIIGELQSLSPSHNPHLSLNLDSPSSSIEHTLPEETNVTSRKKSLCSSVDDGTTIVKEISEIKRLDSEQKGSPSDNAWVWVAGYVTLAQAGLVIVIVLFYAAWKLLDEFLRPMIWAVLFSIPLRGIQDALVEFWSEPLRQGLSHTFLAVPVAVLRAVADTMMDVRNVHSYLFYGKKVENLRPKKNGFLRLVRRLVSFSLFVFAYEQIGRFGAATLLGLGFIFSSNLSASTISAVSTLRSDSFRVRTGNKTPPLNKVGQILGKWILSRLKTILAIGLIFGMIVGIITGMVFISYQIVSEGKDAVISIQSHVQDRNFAESVGITRWVNENEAMELMDWYTTECYETLLYQIDNFADKYNLSDLMEVVKQFVITPYIDFPENLSSSTSVIPQETKYTLRFRNLMKKPVLDKAKCFAAQGMSLSFRILTSSKFILDRSAHFMLYIGHIIVMGVSELMEFLLQLTVFFLLLYYLLTTDSGGVTEQLMKVIPVKKPVKNRCVEALNNAISEVLLATLEIAFFQASFTWLLCRLFSVHFVYMSTMMSFVSPLLPIFPAFLSSLPGAVELVVDGKYALGVSFFVSHVVGMDYGAYEIAEYVPGYSTYLTGVSIIGGMTLFPSPLEGAIMGPLITTVVIALKDLYTEFVLNEPKEKNE